ncbi:MAG: PspC domain-containing protein [Coxiellaceae bacterium]|nr:PspC domain-containing protein [Coxiellaceae bacterium]
MAKKKLRRSSTENIIGGVCSGLGEYFGISAARFRLVFLIVALFYGAGIVLYIVLWFLIPKAPEAESEDEKYPDDDTPVDK